MTLKHFLVHLCGQSLPLCPDPRQPVTCNLSLQELSRISYKWYHTNCSFLCLASGTAQWFLRFIPAVCVSEFILLLLNCISLLAVVEMHCSNLFNRTNPAAVTGWHLSSSVTTVVLWWHSSRATPSYWLSLVGGLVLPHSCQMTIPLMSYLVQRISADQAETFLEVSCSQILPAQSSCPSLEMSDRIIIWELHLTPESSLSSFTDVFPYKFLVHLISFWHPFSGDPNYHIQCVYLSSCWWKFRSFPIWAFMCPS